MSTLDIHRYSFYTVCDNVLCAQADSDVRVVVLVTVNTQLYVVATSHRAPCAP